MNLKENIDSIKKNYLINVILKKDQIYKFMCIDKVE